MRPSASPTRRATPFWRAEILYSRGLLRCYSDDYDGGVAELEAGFDAIDALSEETMRAASAVDVWLADSLPSSADSARSDGDLPPMPLFAGGLQHRRGSHPWFPAVGGHLDTSEAVGETFVRDLSPEQSLGSLLTSAAGHANQGLGLVYAARGRPAGCQDRLRSRPRVLSDPRSPRGHRLLLADRAP